MVRSYAVQFIERVFRKKSAYEAKEKGREILMRGKSTLPVKVRILEVEWLSEDLPELYVHMAKQTDIDLFGNDFIKILLEQNAYNWQIFFKVFVFYFVYAIACILYFSKDFIWVDPSHFAVEDYQDNSAVQRALIIVLGVLLIIVELF